MTLRKTPRTAAVPAGQMDWLRDLPAQHLSAAQTLQWLNLWTEQGLLRHIDSALAAQLLRLDAQASPALLVAAALLAHMEGRGHTCLPLVELGQAPVALLAWPHLQVIRRADHFHRLRPRPPSSSSCSRQPACGRPAQAPPSCAVQRRPRRRRRRRRRPPQARAPPRVRSP